MKYLLIIVSLIVLYIFVEGVIFYYKFSQRPELEEHVHEDIVLGSGEELRYIALGDSTAAGEGASSIENTYTYKVASELSKKYKVSHRNLGVRGAQTKDIISDQLEQAIEFKPDIVTISIGANDATHIVSRKTILKNEKEIIDKLLRETEADIYLTNIPNFGSATLLPWFYRGLLEWRSRAINEEIQGLEDQDTSGRIKIVNIHDFGWNQFPDLSLTNAPDRFHPNDLGYQNWTNAFLNRIED